jgi:hypothetical protein
MANDQESRGGGPEDLGQDPFVERLRPDPSQPPERVRILEGILGDSDREGYKRLYFNRELDYYAEFRTEDVVFSEPIPSDQPPLVGLEATRLGIRWNATIEYTRLRTPRPVDEFDLDIRLTALRRRELRFAHDTTNVCCIDDPGTQCPPPNTERTECFRCPVRTDTCHTRCRQDTCNHPVVTDTCDTQCNQATCQQTCATCHTQCGQDTCNTCRTDCSPCPTDACHTEVGTCVNTRCNTCRC